jgi:hypothetical protein
MNVDLPPGAMEEIVELVFKNQKLQACKRYREMAGVSLAESKRSIDELTTRLRQESPDRFEKTSKSGCAALLLAGISICTLAASTCAWLIQISRH